MFVRGLSFFAFFVFVAVSTNDAMAHHNRTLFAFVRALEARDFEMIRPMWSDAAWNGQEDGISVKTLDRWIDESDRAEFEHARGHEINLHRLVMGFKFTDDGTEIPPWVYVLLKPGRDITHMRIKGEAYPCKWQVMRLTPDADEATAFLGKPLDYLNKGFYPTVPIPKRQELYPVTQPLPEGNAGLAAKYPGDFWIEQDRTVIFADDFETHESVDDLVRKWDSVFPTVGAEIVTDASSPTGGKSLALTVDRGKSYAGIARDLKQSHDTLFLRWYMKFESEWAVPETSVHNGASVIAFSPESFQRMSPATPANGRNKFVVNFATDNARGDAPGHLSFYVYHPEQAHNFGDYFYPSGDVQPESGRSGVLRFGKHFVERQDFSPERGRWYCYEYMVKANTPEHRDGRVAAWIDGKLIADFPNLRLRDVSDLKINHIGMRMNIEENTLRANRKWHDNVVVATSYIGPMTERKKN